MDIDSERRGKHDEKGEEDKEKGSYREKVEGYKVGRDQEDRRVRKISNKTKFYLKTLQ